MMQNKLFLQAAHELQKQNETNAWHLFFIILFVVGCFVFIHWFFPEIVTPPKPQPPRTKCWVVKDKDDKIVPGSLCLRGKGYCITLFTNMNYPNVINFSDFVKQGYVVIECDLIELGEVINKTTAISKKLGKLPPSFDLDYDLIRQKHKEENIICDGK